MRQIYHNEEKLKSESGRGDKYILMKEKLKSESGLGKPPLARAWTGCLLERFGEQPLKIYFNQEMSVQRYKNG